MSIDPAALAYDERGLVPVVVQDRASGAVLMLAWANREAVERTLATGEAHFWSRSRGALWRKGETSGNTLRVVEVCEDCDRDALLVRAEPAGPTCHRGTRSCFEPNAARLELGWLWQILEARRSSGKGSSYTARLLADGVDRIARKVGEEAGETIVAAVRADGGGGALEALVEEAADLVYHLLVLLLASGVEPGDLARELLRRHRSAGADTSRADEPQEGRA
jgi:phosphoribosyl-ATP pyrophosphohydrolase/phosphoribosyl-AMP cyclohydrolase